MIPNLGRVVSIKFRFIIGIVRVFIRLCVVVMSSVIIVVIMTIVGSVVVVVIVVIVSSVVFVVAMPNFVRRVRMTVSVL